MTEAQRLVAKWKRIIRSKITFGTILIVLGCLAYLFSHRIADSSLRYAVLRIAQAKQQLAEIHTTTVLEQDLVRRLQQSGDVHLDVIARLTGTLIGLFIGWLGNLGITILIFGLGERRRLAQLLNLRQDVE